MMPQLRDAAELKLPGLHAAARGNKMRQVAGARKQRQQAAEDRAVDDQRFDFSLPMPPSANKYWMPELRREPSAKFGWRASITVTREAKAYKRSIAELCDILGVKPLRGATHLIVRVYPASNRGDLGNSLKVLEDALNAVAWVDDKQNKRIEMEMYPADKDNPRVDVTVMTRSIVPKVGPTIRDVLERHQLLDHPAAEEIKQILNFKAFRPVK